jgi:hypothetical protein
MKGMSNTRTELIKELDESKINIILVNTKRVTEGERKKDSRRLKTQMIIQ